MQVPYRVMGREEWERPGARRSEHRRFMVQPSGPYQGLSRRGEPRHRRLLEQTGQRQVDPQRLPGSRNRLHGQKRMTPKQEKVVVDTNPIAS